MTELIQLERKTLEPDFPERMKRHLIETELAFNSKLLQLEMDMGSPRVPHSGDERRRVNRILFLSERYERIIIPENFFARSFWMLPKVVSHVLSGRSDKVWIRRMVTGSIYEALIPAIPFEILQEIKALKEEMKLHKISEKEFVITFLPIWKKKILPPDPVLSMGANIQGVWYDFMIAQWGEDGQNIAKRLTSAASMR